MPARKRKTRTARILAVIERAQALISDNPGQSLCVLIDVMKPWKLWRPEGHMFFSRTVHRLRII